jgi:hypothetical protein
MYQDYKDLLSAFQSHGVRYLIVGGFAVGFHARATYAALAEFGAPLKDIRPEDFSDRSSFFRFGREPHGFDILPSIPGVDFDAAWERRVEGVIDPATGFKAFFISREDLIASKLASGRKRDLMDVDDIQEAAESQRPKPAKKALRRRTRKRP